jgi:hypothetical protein
MVHSIKGTRRRLDGAGDFWYSQTMQEMITYTVSTFAGNGALVWLAWGLWRLHHRGEDALGSSGWIALIVPLLFILACIMAIKAE